MSYFLLKNPTNLFLISEPYDPEDISPSIFQVRYMRDRSNSKLVKCKNGKWYIRNGKYMFELKTVEAKHMKIVRMEESKGLFIGDVTNKWFLANKTN